MKNIPMLDLRREYEYMKDNIDSAIERCLDHQKWISGPEVDELEKEVAEYLNTASCIGVSSGTDALVLTLRALAIKIKGKEYWDRSDLIITTPFTFTATGDAILRAGATPVFVDIERNTYNMDPVRVIECLDTYESADFAGILPVHLYGQACDMDRITKIADEHNLFVVEDVAQAFGCSWKDRKLGTLGTAGVFSFFPAKNLGCFGDAGMVATNDDETGSLIRMLLKHGGKDKYNVDHIGYNARLDTIQASVLLAKLKYIDEFNRRRKRSAALYTKGLSNIEELLLPVNQVAFINSHCIDGHVYHQYTIRYPERQGLQSYLKDRGVSSMVYYPVPLHKMKVFDGNMKIFGPLTNTEKAVQQVLSLPIGPMQNNIETEYVIKAVKEYIMSNSHKKTRKTDGISAGYF